MHGRRSRRHRLPSTRSSPGSTILYVVLAGWDEPQSSAMTAGQFALPTGEPLAATFHIFVNPLVAVLWLSWPVFLAGALLSWWPEATAPALTTASRRLPAPAWLLSRRSGYP